MENFEILWKNTLDELEKSVSRITFSTFIDKLVPIDLDGSTLVLRAENKLFANAATRIQNKILDAFNSANTGITDFALYVGDSDVPFFTSASSGDAADYSGIDGKYTFESFVVGENNRFAYAAAKAVSEDPGYSYNPLFVYGSSGLGKTHLVQAIANELKATKPNLKIKYTTCEKFTNDLIEVIRQGKAYRGEGGETFRKQYRTVDVLIVDDVQFLSKKQSTQEEFFHTFNELYGNNKQIILTADCHPKEIELLEERLVTRFQGGMTAQISEPSVETKIAILHKKAEKHKYILPTGVAAFLAENSDADIRSLEGLLNKVIFASLLKEEPITLALAAEAINLGKPNEEASDAITTDDIITTVCNYFGVAKADVIGKKKNKELVEPRQICVYLMTELMNIPLVSIGQALGGRDHTTVIYARNKISELIKTNQKTATQVNDLKNLILKK